MGVLDVRLEAAVKEPTTENIRSLSIALYEAMVCAHEFGRYPDGVDHRKVVHLSLWERWHSENKDALEKLLTPYALTAGEAEGNIFLDIIEGSPYSETYLSNFPTLAGDNNPGIVSETAERLVNRFMKDRLFILRVKDHMAKEEQAPAGPPQLRFTKTPRILPAPPAEPPAPPPTGPVRARKEELRTYTWKEFYEKITGSTDYTEKRSGFQKRVKESHFWGKEIFPEQGKARSRTVRCKKSFLTTYQKYLTGLYTD